MTSATAQIPRSDETPRPGQTQRFASRNLRTDSSVAAGICGITSDYLLVRPGTRVNTLPGYLGHVPRQWNGKLPLRAGRTPWVLELCVDAPERLFDRGFAAVWLRTHAAVAEQVDVLDGIGTIGDRVPAPNLTLVQAVQRGSVQPWALSARLVLERSRDALRGRL